MSDTEASLPQIDVPVALRNVLSQLQIEPNRYRLFGIWWWPIKAMLKRSGYGPDQSFLLGSYQDPITAAMVPSAGLQDTLRAAFEEYGQNARFPHSDGTVEAPDGELVLVIDEDAGGL